MKAHWRFWLKAKREVGAEKILNRVIKKAFSGETITTPEIKPYPKINGFVAAFTLEKDISWESFIYEMIRLGQLIGYHWCLSGTIDQQCDGFTHQTSIAGLEAINWACDRPSEI